MAQRTRSKNPDLLFREIMDERVQRTFAFWGLRSGELDHLDRITAFVTHRCNLLCTYCNGPHIIRTVKSASRKGSMLHHDLTVEGFSRFLDDMRVHATVQHVHFTGGEPTVHRDLPKLVALTTNAGALSSVTTNGTADPAVYRALVDAGCTEIRISIDSHSASAFDTIVGVRGAFARVERSIRSIVRLRDDERRDVFLVLNACVGSMNLHEIEATLRFLTAFRPNDIKLLVIAQERSVVLGEERGNLMKRLHELLTDEPPDRYILLRQKIDALADPYAVGLADPEPRAVMRHCFIPMTERTIDGQHYYPCSIYVRCYGKPLGSLRDSFAVQQERILDFVRHHDCCADPICAANCTTCCKVFNVRANASLVADAESVIVDGRVSDEAVAAVYTKIESCVQSIVVDRRPFLIIKPNGMPYRDAIIAFIAERGLTIASSQRIECWQDCAQSLYMKPLTPERIRRTLQIDPAFRILEAGAAEIIRFVDSVHLETLERVKRELRELFPTKRFRVRVGDESHQLRVTVAHTPDAADVERENAILEYFLRKQPSTG